MRALQSNQRFAAVTEEGLPLGNGNAWHLHLHQGGHSLGLDVSSLLLEKKFETFLQ